MIIKLVGKGGSEIAKLEDAAASLFSVGERRLLS